MSENTKLRKKKQLKSFRIGIEYHKKLQKILIKNKYRSLTHALEATIDEKLESKS